MRFVDTNILVASAQEFHPHHLPSVELLASMERATSCTAAHSVAEFYSVTTRLPKDMALRPREAELFVESFQRRLTLISLTAEELLQEVLSSAAHGVVGGRVYDALLLACARKTRATAIYTYNLKHFRQIAPDLADIIREP